MPADYVYVIGGDECPRVKIGHSKAPEHRLAEFKTGFPYRMRVLWRHGGGLPLERALHKRFEHQHREGEWFEFGDIDAVSAVSAATVQLWDDGAIDGKKRPKRFPTVISLNGLLIAYLAPGSLGSHHALGKRQYISGLTAGLAACTAVDDTGQRCGNTVGGYGYFGVGQRVPYPESEAIEVEGGWIVGNRLQLDAVELDRWLRQRCRTHVSPLHPMCCLPEWEPLDMTKHQLTLHEKKPDWLGGWLRR